MNKHQEELLLDDYYTVGVAFSSEPTAKLYTYKVDKSMKVEVDDFVVVLADNEYKIVKVGEVHDEAKIDYTTNFAYKYIIDVIDFTTYRILQDRSKAIAKTLEESKRRALKKEMLDGFKEGLTETDVKLLEKVGISKEWL